MSLEQWKIKYNVFVSDHASGCKIVIAKDGNSEMFSLTDYVVTSSKGGVYWLRARF